MENRHPDHIARPSLGANKLYFGDNLVVLRESIKDESVDLVYLDPPFNSNGTYNLLFKTPKGHHSDAQIEAFEDTWHWGERAEAAFTELMQQSNTDVAEVIRALRSVLGDNDVMAYLAMMAIRLLELNRVLKPTGSLYLHCDPTASHYLKIVLDQVFGAENFQNEIIWQRTAAHGNAKRWGPVHDTLLLYTKSQNYTWTFPKVAHQPDYIAKHFNNSDEDGRKFQPITLTGSGVRHGESGLPWRSTDPTKVNRHWAIPGAVFERFRLTGTTVQERLDALDTAGLIYWPKAADGTPRLKWYADELSGMAISEVWTDISPISAQAQERLGYPTQKPLVLLERIIEASSNEGDIVLDPFCGCGTAVHAAENLKRCWIGIDVTHLAISLVEKRLRDAFPSIAFEVHGTPKDIGGARNLAERDKYQFQWWACSLVNAQPFGGKKKGADSGIDGLIFFQHDAKQIGKIVISVKGGDNVGVAMIRDLGHVIEREKAAMGFLVTLAPASKPMLAEAAGTGFYESPITGAKFPKLQILTIEGLLNKTEQARYPHLDGGGLTFKKPKREVAVVANQSIALVERAPSNRPIPSSRPSPEVLERRLAVVCTLVNRLADDQHFGRTKMAKLFYMADITQKLDLQTTYYREAAGPLDIEAVYDEQVGFEALAVENGYAAIEKDGQWIRYRRGPRLDSGMERARSLLGNQRRKLNRLIDTFRPLNTDRCEIVATLFACWNDLLIDGQTATDDAIIEQFLGAWHEKKRRFSKLRLMKALDWMRDHKIVARGQGAHTQIKKRKGAKV